MPEKKALSYKPGGFYFRKAYREADTPEKRESIFETLLEDHEKLREWCRQHGWIPPKFAFTGLEANDKPGLLIPLPGAQLDLDLPDPDSAPDCPGQVLLFRAEDMGP